MEACRLQLSVLDLSNNALSGLPAEIGEVNVFQFPLNYVGIAIDDFFTLINFG